MIVDIHYHYRHIVPDETGIRKMIKGILEHVSCNGIEKSIDEVLPVYRDYLDDINCDKLISRMDENGIDVTVIFATDNYDLGLNNEQVMLANEMSARAATRHPGRLIALAGIDPRRPDAPTLFRHCLMEFKMSGLKWHPDNGYYPNSKEAYAVLEIANEFNVPLLTHCGLLPRNRSKFSHPLPLDDVAMDFPGLQIIAAHMGHLWWHEWVAIAQYKTNISGDLAMWQLAAVAKSALFRRYLREIIDIIGPLRVIFSTDGPIYEPVISNKEWTKIIKGLTIKGIDGIVFTQEEVDAMLGGNAARIFKLKQKS